MSKLENIAEIFAQHGKCDTPVAVIQNGTLPNEQMVVGTVKDIYFRVQHAGLTNPAIIVVGEVVKLHPKQLGAQVRALVQKKEWQ